MGVAVLEISLVIIIWTLLITQVIIPAFKGIKLFPFFRKERHDIEEKITEFKEEKDVDEMRRKLFEEQLKRFKNVK